VKIAVLISGSPRFCKEFDTLIDQLSSHDVDWYFHLWSKTPGEFDSYGMKLVADPWRDINEQWALEKIRSNLPTHHRIKGFKLEDSSSVKIPAIRNIVEAYPERAWPMFYGFYQVDLLRQELNEEYDLVVRTRNDVEIRNKIDFQEIKCLLDVKPEMVFTANNNRFGKHHILINDFIAISSTKNIQIYCDTVNHILNYIDQGRIFHPETLLVIHLAEKNNLEITYMNFDVHIRSMGYLKDEVYYSDFGRWA
jgi:hypothetical protein